MTNPLLCGASSSLSLGPFADPHLLMEEVLKIPSKTSLKRPVKEVTKVGCLAEVA